MNGKLPAIIARRAGTIPVIAVVGRSDITRNARGLTRSTIRLMVAPFPVPALDHDGRPSRRWP